MSSSPHELRRYALALAIGCSLSVPPLSAQDLPSTATAAPIDYRLPAGSLAETLNRIASLAGRTISVDPELLKGRRAPAIEGRMSAEQAARRALAGSGLVLAGTPSGAWTVTGAAAAQAQAADDVIVTGALSVEGRHDGGAASAGADRFYRSAQSGAYLDRTHMQRFRGTSVGDIVAGTPGVLAGENRNSGALDLNIRGMQGMDRVPVVIDGSQQSTVVYRGYSGVASRTYLDPDLLAEMTIEKGPSASPEGVGATGGVAVARTIEASDILDPGDDFGIRLRGELLGNTSSAPPLGTKGGIQTTNFGSWLNRCVPSESSPTFCDRAANQPVPVPASAYQQPPNPGDRPNTLEPTDGGGSVVLARRWDHLELVGAYARRRSGNYYAGTHGNAGRIVTRESETRTAGGTRYYTRVTWDGDTRFRAGEQVINSAYDNTSYLLKGKLHWGDGHSLDLGYNRFDSDFGDMMPSEIIRGEGFRQGLISNVTVDTYTSRYRFDPAGNDLIDLRASLWRTDLEAERNLYYGILVWMGEYYPDGIEILPASPEFSERRGFDIDNTSRWAGRWGDLSLRYGLSLTKEDIHFRHDPLFDLGIPSTGQATADLLGSQRHDGKRDQESAFVSAQWTPWHWLTVDAALRYTRSHSYDRKLSRTNLGRDQNNQIIWSPWEHMQQRNSATKPIFAATFEPWDGVQFYLRHAEAMRTPSLFESTSGFSLDQQNPLVDLKPEHARNREAGINFSRDGVFTGGDTLRLHLAYFDNKVRDYLTRINFAAANIELAHFKGAELSAEYDSGFFFGKLGINRYTELDYCYYTPANPSRSFQKCTDQGIGYADLQVPPERSASLTLGLRPLDARMTLGVRGTYNDERSAQGFAGAGRAGNAWSAYSVFDLFADYEIDDRMSIDFNVDNVGDRYYADALLVGLTPAPGRTFRLGFTYKF